ncbi:MAG: glycosyltransferase family 2 protein [Deltaproteobacteria bacterium]|nr:glycosyltransferase family 2 protein [Deltaproteobacteria bacterium]
MSLTLSYVVPVHNEEPTLERNVDRLAEHLQRFPGSRVLLIENGSQDQSWELCQRLAGPRGTITVEAYREPNAGMGYALQRGVVEELPRAEHTRWLVLTAADLPFGFTDLDGLEALLARDEYADVVVGSKAHPDSVVQTGLTRSASTLIYRGVRRLFAGMRTKDSQGTFLFRAETARDIAEQIKSRDFFWSTEFTFYAERAGLKIVEVPVVLEEAQRASTVRPFKHGRKMLAQLVSLRAQELGLK